MDYFSSEEISTQFSDLLHAYRRYHLRDASDPHDNGAEFKEMAGVALDTFRAAFGTRLTRDEGTLVNGSEQHALDTILRWAQERNPSACQGYTMGTAEDCSQRLMELTTASSRGESGAMWPFIKKIRYILSQNFQEQLS